MTRKLPPLNALRAFEAAARHQSFKAAAEELNVSQSAISHQIKKLEERLNVSLFKRGLRTVTLSAAGRDYFPHIRDAMDKMDAATKNLQNQDDGNILTIQTHSTLAVRWLIPKLQAFNADYPDFEVRVITSQMNPNFRGEYFDLAIMIGKGSEPDLIYEYLFTPEMFLVCSPKILNQDTPLNTPEDLENFVLLQVYPSEKDWEEWLDYAGLKNIDPNNGLRFDSYDHALKMAARGHGVALGMQPYVDEDFATKLLTCPLPEFTTTSKSDWNLVHSRAQRDNKKIKTFKAWLLQQINEDSELARLRLTGPGA